MSTNRSPQTPPQQLQSLATGLIRLTTPVQSLEDETALQSMLEEIPGVSSVLFPADNQIEVRYNTTVTGERSFAQTLQRAGYALADFGQRRSSTSPMRHSAIRPLPPRG